MDKRTTGIIATLAATLFCGLPGLIVFCITPIIAFFVPLQSSGGGIDRNMGPAAAIFTGLGIMCLGLLLIAIPVIVGAVTLRTKTEEELPAIEPEIETETEEEPQPESEAEAESKSDDERDVDEELPDPLG